jgi:adenine-specific DNA methylase
MATTGNAARTAGPRVIRYMGNKTAVLAPIRAAVERLTDAGSLLVDPMAGSQTVAVSLKDRHRLIASDAQEYSAVIGRGWLENTAVTCVNAATLAWLRAAVDDELASAAPGFLEREYAGTYLGRRQCRQLDAMRAAVERVLPVRGDARRWLCLGALMTAACRGQATPGHFAQFLKEEHPRTQKLREVDMIEVAFRTLDEMEVPAGRRGSLAVAMPWRELVAKLPEELADARLWYLDPPYTRDQYSRFYHFLETLARGDEPELAFGARYRGDRFKSAFCSTRSASSELRDLFSAIREHSPGASVLLSYSSRGLLAREELAGAATGLFELARFEEVDHAYSTQGKGRLDGVREWLLSFRPT